MVIKYLVNCQLAYNRVDWSVCKLYTWLGAWRQPAFSAVCRTTTRPQFSCNLYDPNPALSIQSDVKLRVYFKFLRSLIATDVSYLFAELLVSFGIPYIANFFWIKINRPMFSCCLQALRNCEKVQTGVTVHVSFDSPKVLSSFARDLAQH